MKALLKNIQGVRRLVLMCVLAIMAVLTVYWITLFISGDNKIACAFAGAVAFKIAIVIANEFKIKKWKVFAIYFGEAVVVCSSVLMPQIIFFTLLALAVLAGGLLIEAGLCLWLRKNPPPPFFAEKVEENNRPFRSEKQVTARVPSPNHWRIRAHRKLYSMYSQN